MVAAGKVRYYVEDEGRRGGGWFGGGIHDPAQLEELAQQDPPLAELLAQAGPNEIPLPGPDGAGSDGFGGGSGSEIAEWVAETFTPTTVGGRTVYDLASPPG